MARLPPATAAADAGRTSPNAIRAMPWREYRYPITLRGPGRRPRTGLRLGARARQALRRRAPTRQVEQRGAGSAEEEARGTGRRRSRRSPRRYLHRPRRHRRLHHRSTAKGYIGNLARYDGVRLGHRTKGNQGLESLGEMYRHAPPPRTSAPRYAAARHARNLRALRRPLPRSAAKAAQKIRTLIRRDFKARLPEGRRHRWPDLRPRAWPSSSARTYRRSARRCHLADAATPYRPASREDTSASIPCGFSFGRRRPQQLARRFAKLIGKPFSTTSERSSAPSPRLDAEARR